MKKKISTKTILTSLAVLGLSALVYFWYQDSCLDDHSKAINELGKPIVKDVLAFYKEHQRYPNIKESEKILKKSACTNYKNLKYKNYKNLRGEIYKKKMYYDCKYKYKTYSLFLSIVDKSIEHEGLNDAYAFGFSKGETDCSSTLNDNGTPSSERLWCRQSLCLQLSH